MPHVWVICFWIEQIGIAVEYARLPHIEGEPFALTTADGVVQVVSDQAARWGVTPGMSTQGARSLCPDLIVMPYDRAAYEIAACAVWDALATLSSVVEPVSPEISYAELSGDQADVTARLGHLTEMIAPCVGVPLRVGIGRTKLVAFQAAAQQGTDDAIAMIPFGVEVKFLASLPLSALPAHPKLDHKARQRMARLGVRTLGDIWALPPHRLPKSLQRVGHPLLQWAQGFDADPVKPLWPPRTVAAEAKFEDTGNGVDDLFVIERTLLRLAERVSCQLSSGKTSVSTNEFTREMTLRVGLLDGTFLAGTEKLSLPESQVPPLYRASMRLLQRLRIEQPVTSLEVIAGDIGAGKGVQLSLMERAGDGLEYALPHERIKRLDATLGHLRRRYGPRAVMPAVLLAKARRIHLWTHTLGHLLCEPLAQVATDRHGAPIRYWRSRRQQRSRYDVLVIHNRWRETGIRNGSLTDAEVWRVETDPFGMSELCRLDAEWRITASWD